MRRTLIFGAAFGLLLSACSSREGTETSTGFLNLESQRPDKVAAALLELSTSERRRLPSQGLDLDLGVEPDPAEVEFVNLAAPPVYRDGTCELTTGEDFQIRIARRVQASDLTHVAVTFDGDAPDDVILAMWLQSGFSAFSQGASVRAADRDRHGDTVILRLADSDRWNGEILRLRIDLGNDPATYRLRSIRGFHLDDIFTLDPTDPTLTSQVRLEGTRRTASFLTQTRPLVQSVDLTTPSDLVFTYGTHPASPSHRRPGDLRVSVRDGSEVVQLARFRMDPPHTVTWHDARVDLSGYSGIIELMIEVRPAEGPDWVPQLVALGRPRIVPRQPRRDRPNLLLISVDTLRPDHLEAYGYDRTVSPVISRLAAGGTTFLNCVSAAPTTLPSHGSMFTGLSSIQNDLLEQVFPSSNRTLAEILRDAGYQSVAVAGGAFFDPAFGLDQGFQDYSFAGTGTNPIAFQYNDIETNVALATRWLDQNANVPFFMFFHTYEVHSPYDPRVPFCHQYGLVDIDPVNTYVARSNNSELPLEPDDVAAWDAHTWIRNTEGRSETGGYTAYGPAIAQHLKDVYDSEIRVTDDLLQRLFDTLEALGILDNTVVVLTSDHGEAFGEHGRLEHGHLYDTVLKVPLIISRPGQIAAGARFDQTVSLTDLLPTCLELLGLPVPADLDGQSLVPSLRAGTPPAPRATVSFSRNSGLSLRSVDGAKYNVNLRPGHVMGGHQEYFRLDRDPGELVNEVASLTPDDRQALHQEALRHLGFLPGVHLRFTAREEFRFQGMLTLEGSGRPLTEQLRCFPLTADDVEIQDPAAAQISSTPARDWWVHLDPASATAHLAGTLHGDSAIAIDHRVVLDDLRDAPATWTFGPVTLQASWIYPQTEDGAGDGALSPETLEQLRALGYVD